jgi:hypothetical protein
MTPEEEAIAVDAAFQVALLSIGVETLQDALALWSDVPVVQTAEVASAWLVQAMHLVLARREMSVELTVAYYRLARALRTGSTIPDPRNPIPTSVTMQELRAEFDQAVKAHVGPNTPSTTFRYEQGGQDTTPEVSSDPGATGDTHGHTSIHDTVPVETIPGLDSINAELTASAEEEARTVLTALGPVHQTRLQSQIDTNAPAKQVDAERQDAHSKAGTRQAAAAERVALNGGRGLAFSLAEKDPRVIGWVRISTTGTPCGFCAMLISRGLVFYSNSAVYKNKDGENYFGKTSDAGSVLSGDAEEGDLYHDNCHCAAIPVYSREQYLNDPRYATNREFANLWKDVTEGLSGTDALNAWRSFISKRQSDEKTTYPTTVQAA